MEDNAERMQRCREYVESLEEERRKIQVFHRELPLCVELVTQAIDACRQQLGTAASEYFPGRSECSEQTSSEAPMLEEFIPIKRSSSSEKEESHNKTKCEQRNDMDKPLQKADWLRSVQLWNTDPDPNPPPTQDQAARKESVIETKKSEGAFHAFRRDNKGVTATSVATTPSSAQTAAASSTTATTTDTAANGIVSVNNESGSCNKDEKEGQSHRKTRRCWSPELHRRFIHALQQLGGSNAATPKQIRELMKVDGLTNDEVKSHLQKHRLHTRRPRSAAIRNGSNPQQPQFMVVGGLWVPPREYATVAAPTGETNGVAANGIYAPAAAPPPPPPATMKQSQRSPSHSQERESRSAYDNSHSNSPSSSSTHTHSLLTDRWTDFHHNT